LRNEGERVAHHTLDRERYMLIGPPIHDSGVLKGRSLVCAINMNSRCLPITMVLDKYFMEYMRCDIMYEIGLEHHSEQA